ncbi:MAG: right-handed parallel beta-helix repeat-containing protein [Aquabacterium sp.]
MNITDADSGTEQAPLRIEAEKPGTVTFSGAPPLRLTEKDKGRWYFQPEPAVSSDEARKGGQFFVNDTRAVLAREPDAGKWWFVRGPSKDTLVMSPRDAQRVRQLLEGEGDRAIVSLMQSWTAGQHRASRISDKGLLLQPPPRWPTLAFGAAQRYQVANVSGALNAPGEWLAVDGRIAYIPTAEDQVSAGKGLQAFFPRLSTLVRIQGQNGQRRVQHVVIDGVRFAHTAWLTPLKGWTDTQAAVDIGAAVEVDKADHITIRRCEMEHLGGHGIWLREKVTQSEISGCKMTDLGAGGIKIGQPLSNGTGQNMVRDNLIMYTGQDHPGAVAVWVGRSGGNRIEQNVIAHTSYSGISVGWQWGYESQDADDNRIDGNVLLDIGRGQMSDLGAIYTLGPGKGTAITGNFIRHVDDYAEYGAGAGASTTTKAPAR